MFPFFKRYGPKTPVNIAPKGAVITIAKTAIVSTYNEHNNYFKIKITLQFLPKSFACHFELNLMELILKLPKGITICMTET